MGEREDYVLALPCFGAEARKTVKRRLKRKLGCVVNEELPSTALPQNNLDGIEAPKSELKRELDCVVNKVELCATSPPKNLDEVETTKIIENDSKRELGCVVNEVELSAISPPKNLDGVEVPKIIENDSKRELDCVVNEVELFATSPPKNLDGVEISVEVGCVVNEAELPAIMLQKSLDGVGIPMMVDNDLKREVGCVANEVELPATSPQKSLEGVAIPMMVDNDLKREGGCVVNEAELSATLPQKNLDGVETPKIVENDSKRELGCVVNEEELSTTLPRKNLVAEAPKIVQNELKRELGCVVNEAELSATSPRKKLAIEAPIMNFDDISSEVLDPITPKTIENAKENENVSSLEITPPELIGCSVNHDRVSFDETISEGSGNSSTLSCSDEVTRNRGSCGVSTSQVTLEIPEHASTTGIRKITFKFSKSKEEYESKSSVSGARVLSNGPRDGYSVINYNDELGLDDASDRCPYNMELKMSKKVIPDSYPTNVKKLLSTGILEGARVKYKTTSGEKEIPGKIRGCGYLCGCSICNFTNVLSAYEFEQHAGGAKTRHPNNHIFLENGRTIYSIIEELKTAPPGLLEELVTEMAGSSVNQESYRAWKEGLQQCSESAKRERKYQSKSSSTSLTHMRYMSKCTKDEQRAFKRSVLPSKQMGKRPNDSSLFSSGSQKRSCDGGAKKSRDNDLHRMLFLPNGLPDGAYLGYYAKGQKILDGYKHSSGIVCGHCDYEISPSQFEAHAGWAARRQPYRHIYTANGLTLHDLAISLSNGQTLATGNNDDMCTLCGDRGELIPCGSCPRAYHQTCLLLQNAPMGDWHCPNCIDRKGDVGSPNSSKPIIIRLTRVVKNPEIVCGGCVICRENDFSVDQFDDRTVIICDQCEKEYHVGCLRGAGRCDLKELPKDKWFCCNDCNRIYVALRDLVDRGSEAIPSFETFRINRKLLVKGLAKVADNDIQWRVLSGKCRHHEHLPLLSKAVSIFRECFSPIIAKAGRDLIPVMVHGRNISGQEFGGMYCVLLTVKSVVVSAGLLRIFGREMAELPLVATSKEYQGKGYFLALFSLIEKILRDQKVENLVLPATEKAKFMWVNRLGFSDVSQERLSAYTREFQLTEFSGTIMLEKKVKRVMDDFDVE